MCYTNEMTDETSEMTDKTAPKPWEQQPGEPPKWYSRFGIYLGLGPTRTPTAAYRVWTSGDSKLSRTASKRAKEWRWEERAIAWDKAGREEKAAFESAREAEARERNLHLNTKIFEAVSSVFDAADLFNLSKEEARAYLPSLRGFLRTASELQRRERQSLRASDHFSANEGWPELDPEIEKILDMYTDENQETD